MLSFPPLVGIYSRIVITGFTVPHTLGTYRPINQAPFFAAEGRPSGDEKAQACGTSWSPGIRLKGNSQQQHLEPQPCVRHPGW